MSGLLATAVLLLACSSKDAPATVADAAEDEGVEDAAPPPVDPALFDCRATKSPARRSTIPEACLRDPTCKTRLVSGHRGAGGDLGRIAPEDTLAAYRAAIVMGIDLVETDPRPTKDGVMINMHDPDLDRTTNGSGPASEKTYAEIEKLTLENTLGLAGDYSCEKIPTLRQILELCRGRALVLVDANKSDRVDLMVKDIQETNTLDWAVFDTSQLEKIDQALVLEPKLMIMPRIRAESEAAPVMERYKTHVPVFVEVAEALFPRGADVIHAGGSRVFTDVFLTDVGVKLGSSPSKYLEIYDKGAEVLQTDLPDLVTTALGRDPTP